MYGKVDPNQERVVKYIQSWAKIVRIFVDHNMMRIQNKSTFPQTPLTEHVKKVYGKDLPPMNAYSESTIERMIERRE